MFDPIAFLIAAAFALIAAGLHALVGGSWNPRAFAAMFVFALALLVLPGMFGR